MTCVPIRRGNMDAFRYRGSTVWSHREMTICKPRMVSIETNPVDSLILDVKPAEMWENKCVKLPSLWYAVIVAWKNRYSIILMV